MALSETISTVRSAPPYQSLTEMGIQAVFGSSTIVERFARREPFRGGLQRRSSHLSRLAGRSSGS
jgi:hypothetical protein